EHGQRNREPRLERLLRERERVLSVLAAQRLLVGAAPHVLAAVARRETRVRADLVLVEAAAVLLAVGTLLPADNGVELRVLLSEPRPGGRQGQRRAVTRGGGLHAPAGRPFAGAQRLQRRVLRLGRVLPGLRHRGVLLGDRVHGARRGPADVRLRRVLLGSLEPGLRQHRARQLVTQADVVARRQGRDALREVRRQEALLARTAV